MKRFTENQRRGPVSSVALDPATGGLVLDTDSLGELAMSDIERVL
jgi:hypothetical protein